MKKAALYAGIIAALICGTTFATVISGTSAGSSAVYTTPVVAQYTAASYGSGLANESIAAGTDSALYCATDNLDGTTSTPECGLNAIRHKGVGPGSTTNYLQATVATTTDIRAASGIWTECFIWRSDSLAAAQGIFSLATGATGRSVSVAATTGAVSYYVMSGGYVAASVGTIRAADTNQFCAGRDSAGKLYWNFNGTAGGGAVYSYTAPVGAQAEFARAGAVALNGHLFEYAFADAEPTPASLAAIWTSVSTCRTRGRCLPDIGTLTAGGTFALVGDDYTIGANWCGDSACSRYVAPVGVVPTREARYSWPFISWAQAGTVPRVATSGIHRQGYGARHASLGPFSAANYVSLGSGLAPDVLDFTGDFTECAIIEPTPVDFSGYASIISNTNATTRGYELFASADFTLRARFWLPGVADAVSSAVVPNSTVAVCWGRQGTTGRMQVGGGVVGTVATVGYLPASSAPALIGDNAARPAFAGKVHEFFATSTPASSEYLTYLTDAAMRCTTQGNCFPRDANTVMSCTGDEFTGGVLRCGINTGADPWTTNGTVTLNPPTFYQNITAQRISASGAGPFNVAAYFVMDPSGTGIDVLDFTGSWRVCAAFDTMTGTTTNGTVIMGGYIEGSSTPGWQMLRTSAGALECGVSTYAAGNGTATTAVAAPAGAMNLGCCGWDAATNTIYAKLNASAVATAVKPYEPATTVYAQIGAYSNRPLNGRVYEVLALNGAPTDAWLDTIHRRWTNHQSLTGQALTNTHTVDTSTYHSAGKVWTRGVNTQRQESAKSVVIQPYVSAGAEVTAHTPVPPGYLISGGFTNAWTQDWYLDTNSEGVTLVKNAALAPDGTMTAATIRETATTATHQPYLLVRPAVTGAQAFSASVYIRPVSTNNCLRAVFYPNKGTLSPYNTIDIDLARDAQSTYSTYAGNPLNGHEHLADGWIRVWWSTGNATFNAEPNVAIRIQPGSAPCNFVAGGWAGNVNNGFDLWGGQFVYSSTTTANPSIPIYPFCARGATCTAETITVPNPLRPNGSDWTNLLLQSEDLATTWSGVNTAVLVNSALAPDGSFTADKLYENDATNGVHYTLQAYTATAVPWTVSFKAKPAERSWLLVSPDAGASTASFDLSTCAAGAVSAGVTSTASASSAPGWCDFSLTKTMAAGATSVRIFLCTAAGSCSYAGVAGSGVFLWGLQAEPASAASPYCPTTTAARTCGPGGATGKTVTNLHFNSENVASWSHVSNVTPSLVSIAGPASTLITANRITEAATVGTHFADNNPTVGAATNALSFEMKPDTRSWIRVYKAGGAAPNCYFDLATPAVGTCAGGATGAIQAIGNGWVRGQVTLVSDAGARFFGFDLATADNTNSYAGDGTSGLWMRYFQREEVAVGAGPYCGPTGAASRTCAPTQRWCIRAKDVTPGYGFPWTGFTSSTHLFDMGTDTTNHAYWVPYSTVPFFLVYDGAGLDKYIQPSLTLSPGPHTITSCAVDGQLAFYVDGTAYTTNAGAGSGVFSAWPATVTIGSQFTGTIGSVDFNTTGDPKDFPSDRRTP